MRASRRLVAICVVTTIALLALPLAAATAALPQGNLLQNPGAESGTCSNTSGANSPTQTIPIPGWTTTGSFVVLCYSSGVTLDPSTSTQIGGGNAYFMGGVDQTTSATQTVDVSGAATDIDAGGVQANLSGYLGGYSGQDDNMVVTATFLDASSQPLGSPVQIGPVLAADRNDQSTLLPESASGAVPAGTRSIQVTMTATRLAGSDNDGAADNLSLTLSGGTCTPQSGTDVPDLSFTDSNCDGIDGTISDAVFVSPSGNDANPGTMSAPVADIMTALGLAHNESKSQILVATGTYGKVTIQSPYGGIGIYGGYDPVTWQRSVSNVSMIKGSPEGVNVSNVPSFAPATFQLVSIHGDPDNQTGSAYGVRAHDGANVILQRVTVTAANALPGGDGASGVSGGRGEDGMQGMDGCPAATASGCFGGSTSSGPLGPFVGIGGGKITAAERSNYSRALDPYAGDPARNPVEAYDVDLADDAIGDLDDFAPGGAPSGTLSDQLTDFDDDPSLDTTTQGSPGGDGGPYGADLVPGLDGEDGWDFEAQNGIGGAGGLAGDDGYAGQPAHPGSNGSAGRSGTRGADGAGGTGSGGASWTSGDGSDGHDGTAGAGGGGGGMAGFTYPCQSGDYECLADAVSSGGNGGGGGGAGGGFGEGGQGGQGGGGSFGVYSYNSTVTISDGSSIRAGNGGNGGNGGRGGAGGAGGNGGRGSTYDSSGMMVGIVWVPPIQPGGNGGAGGGGGGGGNGGGGAGGPSAALYSVGTAVQVAPDSTLSHGAAGAGGTSPSGAAANGQPGSTGACVGSCTSGGSTGGSGGVTKYPLVGGGIGVLHGGVVPVPVFCRKIPCVGTVTVQTVPLSARPIALGATARAGRSIRLGSRRFAIRHRGLTRIQVHVGAVRRLLRGRAQVPVQLRFRLVRGRHVQKVAGLMSIFAKAPPPVPAIVRGVEVAAGGQLLVPVRCGSSACRGSLVIRVRHGHGPSSLLVRLPLRLRSHANRVLSVPLTASERARLLGHGRLSVSVDMIVKRSHRKPIVSEQPVTLGAAPPGAGHRRVAGRASRTPAYAGFGSRP